MATQGNGRLGGLYCFDHIQYQIRQIIGHIVSGFIHTADHGNLEQGKPAECLAVELIPNFNQFSNFIDSVKNNKTPVTPGEHGLQVQKVIDAIYLSSKTKKEVKIT